MSESTEIVCPCCGYVEENIENKICSVCGANMEEKENGN
jgi:ribosomal protein L37E